MLKVLMILKRLNNFFKKERKKIAFFFYAKKLAWSLPTTPSIIEPIKNTLGFRG